MRWDKMLNVKPSPVELSKMDTTNTLTRRAFLKTSGAAGVALVAGAAGLLAACTTEQPDGEAIYSIVVKSGAIITDSNLTTGRYKYKKKCSSCGYESMLATTVEGTSVFDEFKCPRCGHQQKIVIEVSSRGSA